MSLAVNVIYILAGIFLMALVATMLLFLLKIQPLRLVRLALGALGLLLIFGGIGLVTAPLSLMFCYILLSLTAFALGVLSVGWGNRIFPWFRPGDLRSGFLTTCVWALWSIFGFAIIYGLRSEKASVFLPVLLVGILPFVVPYLCWLSYNYWVSIPQLRYRRWYYDGQRVLPVLEPINVIQVNIHFTKTPDEAEPSFEGYLVEFPGDVDLGTLYQYFIYSHNNRHRDYKKSPITYIHNGRPVGWVMFKQGPGNERLYLDAGKSLRQNSVRDHDTILAQSYSD
ncbi:TssN family type VI secretion system protein [Dyadobacter sp. CY261]|uniref:TssN family type VI secretion system protein n=1 Tax=Dyadobacter sp. CY261 TaxID=2907203 RepID=UPI001F33E0CE|nr:TssN family type VI secretion system protein [Dyadobacter sp. CY261]MCF0075103.1 TssN family type VI secretion system protein [Dyadobacter sp. CY261]